MLKFNIDKGLVIADEKSLLLSELRDIWNDDDSITKENASKLLTYIHLVSQIDPDAPFANAPFYEVKQLVTLNTWREPDTRPSDEELESLNYTIDVYRIAFENEDRRTERTFTKKIDQLNKLIDDTDPQITADFKTNVDIITKLMKDMGNLMDVKDAMKARVKKESEEKRKLMGDKKESILEKQHGK